MIHFFGNIDSKVFAVQTTKKLSTETIAKLTWLFADQPKIEETSIDAFFVGPRAAMITPWSTNAVEITRIWVFQTSLELKNLQLLQKSFLTLTQ